MLENREYYEWEKEDYANGLNYYGKKRGEECGWTLADPYKESELLEFETINNIRLPEELRYYLTAISRETVSSYAYIIKLEMGTIMYINEKGYMCKQSNHKDDLDDLHKKRCENYFMQINEKECAQSDYICVKGSWYGGFGSCATINGDFQVIHEDLQDCLN